MRNVWLVLVLVATSLCALADFPRPAWAKTMIQARKQAKAKAYQEASQLYLETLELLEKSKGLHAAQSEAGRAERMMLAELAVETHKARARAWKQRREPEPTRSEPGPEGRKRLEQARAAHARKEKQQMRDTIVILRRIHLQQVRLLGARHESSTRTKALIENLDGLYRYNLKQ
ncbi:MAG: hypothetical protein AB7S38_38085 [Vulcanimicrobiota bacterium]